MAIRPKYTETSNPRARDCGPSHLELIRRARDENAPVSGTRPVELALDEIVRRANLLQAPGTWSALERMRMLGELVFRTIYEDDENQWRILGGHHPQYKALLAHPKLRIRAMMLWRALHVRSLFRRLPALHSAEHVGLSHVCAVIGLDEATQAELLALAERDRWSARRLELAVRARRGKRRA